MQTLSWKRLAAAVVSVVLLAAGWIGLSGLTLLCALVPLLWLSESYGSSRRDFWHMAAWSAAIFVLWNAATIWWVWIASPAGPITATVVSVWWNLLPLMAYHYVSKRAHRALAYVLLVSGWITTEYIYNMAPAMSFPWLTLGNGFSEDVWAVQWYEWTGVFGGSLWVLLSNICLFEVWRRRTRWSIAVAAATVVVPLAVSLTLYIANNPTKADVPTLRVSVLQPNVDCYDKFHSDAAWQISLLEQLLVQCPPATQLVLMPETALATTLDETNLPAEPIVQNFSTLLREHLPQALLITGSETLRVYPAEPPTQTAREKWGTYYDVFNASLGIAADAQVQLHHKGRMVIGVETVPAWLRHLKIASVDLGGMVGQLGIDGRKRVFTHNGVRVAPAICYEALYGGYMADFAVRGAQLLAVVSNDGWWGDTDGYRRLFGYCRLRAVETRRWVARSANTGISGFIDWRGGDIDRMGWNRRGVLSAEVGLSDRTTLYMRYGDYVARAACFLAFLSIIYFVAYRIKRRHYLAE